MSILSAKKEGRIVKPKTMEKETSTFPPSQNEEPNLQDEAAKEVEQLQLSLPKETGFAGQDFYLYHNFWCPARHLPTVISVVQDRFQAQDTDILLASKPKSGTTWLKAMAFTILNRRIYPTNNQDPSKPHPLLTSNPHALVPLIKYETHTNFHSKPRLIPTHIPYHALPESMKKSGWRIVYICRNILDTCISYWKFACRIKEARDEKQEGNTHEKVSTSLEECLDYVCKGMDAYGPYWDHVLGYWQESLRRPDKVMFIKYENVKVDEKSEMKRLAEFLGCPFSREEEESGVIGEISKLCSFQNLKELEINKSGQSTNLVENSAYFRKGEVGDWKNYMTPSMVERLQSITQEKFQGSGLSFNISINND